MDDMLNVPSFANNQDNLEVMKSASLNNKSGNLNGKKKLSRRELLKRIKYVSSVVLVSAGINMGGHLVSETADNLTLRYAENDFWDEAVENNIHKTDDGQHFYYDYAVIGDYVENMDDSLEGVYFLNKTISAHVDDVLQYTSYENLDNAIVASGYKDLDEFMDSYKKQILLDIELDKVKENNSIGGK